MSFTKSEIKTIAIYAGFGVATGTDTYAVTISGVNSYTAGMKVAVQFTNANTGASTININGLGAKNIYKLVATTLALGDIPANNLVEMVYDGTNFQTIGGTDLLTTIYQRINSASSNFSQSII